MYEYEVNYFYFFSDELLIDKIDNEKVDDYVIIGVPKRDEPMFMGILVNEMHYKYCHVFKCFKTVMYKTDRKDGNIGMLVYLKDVLRLSEHITSFGGMVSNVGL